MEVPVYNPYNPRNRMFTQKDIHSILHKHDCEYTVKNLTIFQNAMVHSSYVKRAEYTTPQGDTAQLAEKPTDCLELFPGRTLLAVEHCAHLSVLPAQRT
jgi:hypothetical protein